MTDGEQKTVIFNCGPDPKHICDTNGPGVKLYSQNREGVEYCSGESVSCSVCGMSAFERGMWDGE